MVKLRGDKEIGEGVNKIIRRVGLYSDGLFFALPDDDALYFKVDDAICADYAAAGMGPFQNSSARPASDHGY
ncbi:hypothetical protein BH23GEM3_BH23GEM3_03900 [soil metagenome]|nr:TfoX/Sxy family protein [Gemmatimonadota bacterium]